MVASNNVEAAAQQYINREHTTFQYAFMLTSISMCITVDILQYAMPLAFLPSVLEDRGHSPEMIATAIGIYYWTGLLGGIVLTSYEVWKMMCLKNTNEVDLTPFLDVKRQIKVIIFNLGIGVITLFVQANIPRWHVHTTCRFIQGFVGAFLFFYVFLLNVAIFKGQQQVIAMTCASCATVLAELAGPLLGSIMFDLYGQRSVFWFLGVVSLANQGMLVAVLYMVRPTTDVGSAAPSRSSSPLLSAPSPGEVTKTDAEHTNLCALFTPQPGSWAKMKALLSNPTFICAVLIITMAGVIKGSVEEMMPFHADHEWGYDPIKIGKLFCTTAISYFVSSAIVAWVWTDLGRFQTGFSSQCILLMGVTTWMSFHVYYYYQDETILFATFAGYGFCAGLTFTAAAQLIAQVVDQCEGHAKDAANGIWNTMWEFGGSTGFALGGFLAHHYHEQMNLTSVFVVCAFVTATCMVIVGGTVKGSNTTGKKEKSLDYGGTA
jgi:MFS family permease